MTWILNAIRVKKSDISFNIFQGVVWWTFGILAARFVAFWAQEKKSKKDKKEKRSQGRSHMNTLPKTIEIALGEDSQFDFFFIFFFSFVDKFFGVCCKDSCHIYTVDYWSLVMFSLSQWPTFKLLGIFIYIVGKHMGRRMVEWELNPKPLGKWAPFRYYISIGL